MRASLALAFGLTASTVTADGCSPLHYIYARATTEVPTGIKESTTEAQFVEAANKWWSLGYGAAGGGLWLNLTKAESNTKIEGITGYAVPYPADATFSTGPGSRSSPQIGIDLMVEEFKRKATACPQQKYIFGGHSQGGGVTVGAIKRLANETGVAADAMQRLMAVTMFGSPPCPAMVKDRCMSYCHKGDFACDPAAKGNMPKLPKMPSGGASSPSSGITPTRRWADGDVPCPQNVAEAGYTAKVGSQTGAGPHLSYNQDGYYIKAAACYINEKYKASK